MSQNETHASSFEQLYLKERKKSRIFMASTTVALLLMVGSIAYASTKKTETPEGPIRSFGEGGQTMPLHGDGPGGGGLRMALDVDEFFNDDGSVDTEQVSDMLERVPDDFREDMLTRMESRIDEAAEDDDITAEQASALKSAFGITGDTDES